MKRVVIVSVLVLVITAYMFNLGHASTSTLPRSLSTEAIGFLKANYQDMNQKGIGQFQSLLPYLENKRVFLAGEIHGMTINSRLFLELLMFLYDKANVRNVILEGHYSIGQLLNIYLSSGDEEILDLVFSIPNNFNTYGMREAFKEIYFHNSNVEESERISVVGVECEMPYTALLYLSYLLPEMTYGNDSLPQALCDLLELVHSLEFSPHDYLRDEKILGIFQGVNEDIHSNELQYEELLGESLFDLQHVVKSVLDGFSLFPLENALGDVDFMNVELLEKREQISSRSFLKLYPRMGEGNFFGQFGYYHVYQRKTRFVDWFATHLTNNTFAGKVLSLVYMYENSHRLSRCFDERPSQVVPYSSEHLLIDLDKLSSISDGPVFLLPLVGDDSPFAKELNLKKLGSGGVTTDYFHAAIFIRGAEPARPYFECP